MTKRKQVKKLLPPNVWKRGRSGRIVCQCGKGYGSEYDGLCFNCRGVTAWQAAHGIKGEA